MAPWMEVEQAWQQAAHRLQAAIDLVHVAEKIMLTTQHSRHRPDLGSGEDESVAWELAALAQRLLEQKQLGQRALMENHTGVNAADEDNDMVYWLRMPPAPSLFTQQRQVESSAAVSNTPSQPSSLPNAESSPVLYTHHIHTPPLFGHHLPTPRAYTIFPRAPRS